MVVCKAKSQFIFGIWLGFKGNHACVIKIVTLAPSNTTLLRTKAPKYCRQFIPLRLTPSTA